jgi:hypothetical protein
MGAGCRDEGEEGDGVGKERQGGREQKGNRNRGWGIAIGKEKGGLI